VALLLAFRGAFRFCGGFGAGGTGFIQEALRFKHLAARDEDLEVEREGAAAFDEGRYAVGIEYAADHVGFQFGIDRLRVVERDHVERVRYQDLVLILFIFVVLGILRHASRISQNVESAPLQRRTAARTGEREMPVPFPAKLADDSEGRDSNTLTWFLAGAILGVAIAVVCAPKSGKDTRQFLSEKAQEGKERVVEGTRDAIDAGRDMFERGRKLVEDAADLFERGRRLVRGDTSADSDS
jgi:hypothetical protein